MSDTPGQQPWQTPQDHQDGQNQQAHQNQQDHQDQQTPGGPQAPQHGQQPYPGPGAYADPLKGTNPGLATGTPFIWVIAVAPLLSLLGLTFFDLGDYLERMATITPGVYQSPFTPGYAAYMAFSFAVYALTVVLAWLDHRALAARGLVRPFPWPWAFLSLVYTIGRSVVVKRRTGGGLAPLWVFVAAYVVTVVVAFVVFVSAFAEFVQTMPSLPTAP